MSTKTIKVTLSDVIAMRECLADRKNELRQMGIESDFARTVSDLHEFMKTLARTWKE